MHFCVYHWHHVRSICPFETPSSSARFFSSSSWNASDVRFTTPDILVKHQNIYACYRCNYYVYIYCTNIKFDWTCAIFMVGGRHYTRDNERRSWTILFWTIWILHDHGNTWGVQNLGPYPQAQILASCTRASSTIRALAPIMASQSLSWPFSKTANRIPKILAIQKRSWPLFRCTNHLASMLQLLVTTVQVQKQKVIRLQLNLSSWVHSDQCLQYMKWITGRIMNMPE